MSNKGRDVTWRAWQQGTDFEFYARDIGPFRCVVFPDSTWCVYAAGTQMKMGQVADPERTPDPNKIDKAKNEAEAFVRKHLNQALQDLGTDVRVEL